MTPAITHEAPALHDVRCHRCGYLLRGLGRDGKCPECGSEVQRTIDALRARLLRDVDRLAECPLASADPRWLTRLAVASAGLIAAGVGLLALLCASDGGGSSPVNARMLVAVIGFASIWLLTWAEPGNLDGGGGGSVQRHVLRTLSAVPVLAAALSYVAESVVPYDQYALFARASRVGWLAAPPLAALLFLRLRQLAAVMDSPRLLIQSTVVGIGTGVGTCGAACMVVAEWPVLTDRRPFAVADRIATPVVAMAVLVGFAASIYAVPVLMRFARAFVVLRPIAVRRRSADAVRGG